LNILGGSEFRLRRGFAEGKTLGRAAARSRPIAVKVTKYELEKKFGRA
jgi:hypothetical protein